MYILYYNYLPCPRLRPTGHWRLRMRNWTTLRTTAARLPTTSAGRARRRGWGSTGPSRKVGQYSYRNTREITIVVDCYGDKGQMMQLWLICMLAIRFMSRLRCWCTYAGQRICWYFIDNLLMKSTIIQQIINTLSISTNNQQILSLTSRKCQQCN